MKNKKLKWLIYTLILGLVPILMRFLISIVFNNNLISMVSISDLVALGFILHISIINEIEHLKDEDRDWKTVQNGLSLFFIIVYSMFFCLSIFNEGSPQTIDIQKIKYSTGILVIFSILICYSVYDRLSKKSELGI